MTARTEECPNCGSPVEMEPAGEWDKGMCEACGAEILTAILSEFCVCDDCKAEWDPDGERVGDECPSCGTLVLPWNALANAAVAALEPLDRWASQCHRASIELVCSGAVGPSRVARGTCSGVGSQHSWVVLGDDCYDDLAKVVDPTLWSYDDQIDGVWVGSYSDGRHRPHGKGSIWKWGRPAPAVGPTVELTPRQPWSPSARQFLKLLGPLDRAGWAMLAQAPVEDWPAGEIIDALCESGFEACVPIDIVGMVTDRNPNGLYLPAESEALR